ncbi:MAG TPA: LPS export ABC transporter ATP-binding protein [Longimicrobiales bacterium]|nr:LPS export ABC transporter ATP-binding protein [Longimicrobiales bacterium]
MRVYEFVTSLRPSDASVLAALIELIKGADRNGSMERGEWLSHVVSANRRLAGQTILDGGSEEVSPDELDRYLDDHILHRLTSEGVVRVEPQGEAWERVILDDNSWFEIEPHRSSHVERLETAARRLLIAETAPAHPVRGGSTLRADGLVKAYRKRKVVNEVEVQVSQGEIVGLLGPNGAGKTTTFYMMVGLISPDEGRVFLDAEELTKVPMYQRARRGIGYLAQEPSIFRKLTVEQNVLAILETMRLKRSERKARLESLLDELGLKHLRKSKAYSLSGGERRRLEITRALVSDPKFMLLDEPFAGVDPIAVHDIQQIVANLRLRGIGVIITDHNVEQTLDIVDRAYIMYEGRVRVAGTVAELVWNEEVAEIYFGPTLTARMRERYSRPLATA